MRKTAWILAGLMIVASVAMAATAPTGDTPKDKGTTAATGDQGMDKGMSKSKAKTKWEHCTGEVTAVDATAKTITVKCKDGEKTFKWDDKTVVTPKGKTPAVGDHVTVTHAKDSDMATKIAIHKAKAAKPAAEKKPS